MLKRIFDISFSLMGLTILSPLFIIISVLIKFSSRGTILFKQKRVGHLGKLFFLYKFRTMQEICGAENGRFDVGDTKRVTSVGTLLRKYKLDELPQLINVLKGDMSLVGPRPEIQKWVDEFPDDWKIIHKVKPGITDPASIIYRNEEDILSAADDPINMYRTEVLPRKIKLYINYVSKNSLHNDIILIFKTFIAILHNK